jgi:hypothetical protein
VWVRPRFYLLNFNEKEKFVSVVYAYYFEGHDFGDAVKIVDSLSGKEVGSFDLRGLTLK